MGGEVTDPESLIPAFKYERVLNQDQAGRRIILEGTIHTLPALLILERAPWPTSPTYLSQFSANLSTIQNLGANDVYFWYLASSPSPSTISALPASSIPKENKHEEEKNERENDLKINLIYPSTAQHIKKYSSQRLRMVVETPEIYAQKIRPYMQSKREAGRLNWVYNIIQGITEVEDVIFRTPLGETGDEGFLILPDMNWDRKTMTSLRLLGLVERTDIWSLRDLKKGHVGWLRHMRERFIDATVKCYGKEGIERDELKLYFHYQPTYYHLHIHIVHVGMEANATQAMGKAVGMESVIQMLEFMEGGMDEGMEKVELCYTVGEASELWTEIFEPLKRLEKEKEKQKDKEGDT